MAKPRCARRRGFFLACELCCAHRRGSSGRRAIASPSVIFQSSSASRRTGSHSGFFDLSQTFDGPLRYGESSRFVTMPSRPKRQACANTAGPSCARCSLNWIATPPRASILASRDPRPLAVRQIRLRGRHRSAVGCTGTMSRGSFNVDRLLGLACTSFIRKRELRSGRSISVLGGRTDILPLSRNVRV